MNQFPDNTKNLEQKNTHFPQKYVSHVHALLGFCVPSDEGESFIIQTQNTASTTINRTIKIVSEQVNSQVLALTKGLPQIVFDRNSISTDPIPAFEEYKTQIQKLAHYVHEKGETLILGFSSLGGYELLPKVSEIIQETKKKYPNVVYVIGGADFSAITDEEYIQKVFDFGIDIINIGGAKEFTEFIGTLSSDDLFVRDENGILQLETTRQIPENMIFQKGSTSLGNIKPGTKIEAIPFYDDIFRRFYFTIPNNPCLNNCHYCSNHIHAQTPLRDKDIEKAICDFNEEMEYIEDDKIVVEIQNPNPMQYLSRFENFLDNINLKKVAEIGFFGDFIGLGKSENLKKVIEIIENLTQKHPHLHITIHFGIDAFHKEGDGDFVGRTHGKNIVSEEGYRKSFDSIDTFFHYFRGNNQVSIQYNVIFQPNLAIAGYKERLDFVRKNSGKNINHCLYVLTPHPNTQIENTHKGYFMPEHEAIHACDKFSVEFAEANLWGYFYQKSYLLDIFMFLRVTGLESLFMDFLGEKTEKKDDGNKNNFLEITGYLLKKISDEFKKLNSFSSKLQFNKRRKNINTLKGVTGKAIQYLDFMIYREIYIISRNPAYNTSECNDFIKTISELKGEFEKIKEN